jgi:hypothetical protein
MTGCGELILNVSLGGACPKRQETYQYWRPWGYRQRLLWFPPIHACFARIPALSDVSELLRTKPLPSDSFFRIHFFGSLDFNVFNRRG